MLKNKRLFKIPNTCSGFITKKNSFIRKNLMLLTTETGLILYDLKRRKPVHFIKGTYSEQRLSKHFLGILKTDELSN